MRKHSHIYYRENSLILFVLVLVFGVALGEPTLGETGGFYDDDGIMLEVDYGPIYPCPNSKAGKQRGTCHWRVKTGVVVPAKCTTGMCSKSAEANGCHHKDCSTAKDAAKLAVGRCVDPDCKRDKRGNSLGLVDCTQSCLKIGC